MISNLISLCSFTVDSSKLFLVTVGLSLLFSFLLTSHLLEFFLFCTVSSTSGFAGLIVTDCVLLLGRITGRLVKI